MTDGFTDKGGFDGKSDGDKSDKGEKWSKVNSETSAVNSGLGIIEKIVKFFKEPPKNSR